MFLDEDRILRLLSDRVEGYRSRFFSFLDPSILFTPASSPSAYLYSLLEVRAIVRLTLTRILSPCPPMSEDSKSQWEALGLAAGVGGVYETISFRANNAPVAGGDLSHRTARFSHKWFFFPRTPQFFRCPTRSLKSDCNSSPTLHLMFLPCAASLYTFPDC